MPTSENEYNRQILQAIASGQRVTQRSLSGELGVALGLTNLLIRRLVAKGYVKMAGIGTRHVRYLMTPDVWVALSHATRLSLENTVHLYTQTREQIRATLSKVSACCEADVTGEKRVVFYGAGDVAEIAYVSLQSTDLTLVGVVDDSRRDRFFTMRISDPERLSVDTLDGVAYSHVIVATIKHTDAISARIAARGIPSHRVFCL